MDFQSKNNCYNIIKKSILLSGGPDFLKKSGYLLSTAMTNNSTPKLGLNKIFNGSYLDVGLFVAIICAIIIYIIIEKTTFGYELKAGGFNRYVAKYAGMSEKRNKVRKIINVKIRRRKLKKVSEV